MKYSFLIPYYNRAGQFHNTLVSFYHHYMSRNDYEIIIAEDSKNITDINLHNQLLEIIEKFKNKLSIIKIDISIYTWNPCIAFNKAAEVASGEFFIITNPECFHMSDILQGFDEEFQKNPNCYILCSCLNKNKCKLFIKRFEDLNGENGSWYQHSIYRNAQFHFCNAISKENWSKIGGFDEDFVRGTSYEDADFRNRIRRISIPIILRDDLLTIHINHTSLWTDSKLNEINRKIYINKWGS